MGQWRAPTTGEGEPVSRHGQSGPSERQRQVLAAIVREYARTGQPVGSRTAREAHGIEASSATIRNDMAALADLGLIEQPHTSAGRRPTDRGYRYFVEHVMDEAPLELRETARLRSAFRRGVDSAPDVLREAARLLAELLRCPAVVMSPREPSRQLEHFHASPVSSRNVLLVLVTSDGHVENRLVELPAPVTGAQLECLSEILNRRMVGAEVGALRRMDVEALAAEMGDLTLPIRLLEALLRGMEREAQHDVYIDGVSHIMEDPEFQRARELREMVQTLYQERLLRQLLRPFVQERRVSIRIGTENPLPEARGCGVVAKTYVGG
ncbi:MAG: heat-inducible transcription repressor HrcA, partial [Armatimonadetes bacterium]|nr:heat-inducible transcription repressor HrcA [Armatimonadota bacterium]